MPASRSRADHEITSLYRDASSRSCLQAPSLPTAQDSPSLEAKVTCTLTAVVTTQRTTIPPTPSTTFPCCRVTPFAARDAEPTTSTTSKHESFSPLSFSADCAGAGEQEPSRRELRELDSGEHQPTAAAAAVEAEVTKGRRQMTR